MRARRFGRHPPIRPGCYLQSSRTESQMTCSEGVASTTEARTMASVFRGAFHIYEGDRRRIACANDLPAQCADRLRFRATQRRQNGWPAKGLFSEFCRRTVDLNGSRSMNALPRGKTRGGERLRIAISAVVAKARWNRNGGSSAPKPKRNRRNTMPLRTEAVELPVPLNQ